MIITLVTIHLTEHLKYPLKKNPSRTRTSILLNDLEISHMALEGTYS